jgi:hypothetical protein
MFGADGRAVLVLKRRVRLPPGWPEFRDWSGTLKALLASTCDATISNFLVENFVDRFSSPTFLFSIIVIEI